MPLQLTAPIEKVCELTETDRLFGSSGTVVVIRQASQAGHERRSELFSTLVSEHKENSNDDNSVRYIQRFSILELMRIEAYLTVVSSNIIDENGHLLFKEGMSEFSFNRAWGKLPPSVAREIHDKVLEVNPDWLPLGERLSGESAEPSPENS